MKITDLELWMIKPRWMFLKLHTDEGITGYGEPILEGNAHAVAAVIDTCKRYLIGKDPRRIEHHWQALYRGGFYRGGPVLSSALSGIEQALWDILGKQLSVPIYQLLGGAVRDRIRMYSHISGSTLDELIDDAKKKVSLGFSAIKFSFDAPVNYIENARFIEKCVERVENVRTAVGKEVDIALDLHGRFSPALAKVLLSELTPFHLMFVEEPCLPDNVDALIDISKSSTIPIATGERVYTRWGFQDLIGRRAVAIIQPDLCHTGGIFEARKIAAMAESQYLGVAPHNPLGPVSLAACLQLDACTPNFIIQEQVTLGEGVLKHPFQLKDGHITVPTEPGLGIELDNEALEALRYDGNWETPRVWHSDGSVADW